MSDSGGRPSTPSGRSSPSLVPDPSESADSGLRPEWITGELVAEDGLIASGLMHPEKVTILFGEPGSGKGFMATWIARQLVTEGYTPLILDWEKNRPEWLNRLVYLDANLRGIVYCEIPYTHVRGSAGIEKQLREVVDTFGITAVIWDSATASRPPARDGDMGGEESARQVLRILANMGVPALVIAHQAKSFNRKQPPKSPYGSMAWVAEARLVWRIDKEGSSIRLVPTKSNMMEPRTRYFRMVQGAGHAAWVIESEVLPSGKPAKAPRDSQKQGLLAIFDDSGGLMSVAEIGDAWVKRYPDKPLPKGIRVVLTRMVEEGSIVKDGTRYRIAGI